MKNIKDETAAAYSAEHLKVSPVVGADYADVKNAPNHVLAEHLIGKKTKLRLGEYADLRAWAEETYEGQVVMELAQRVMLEELKREVCLTSSSLTRHYIRARMRAYTREVFLCIFLDNQHRVIAVDELFYGTIDGSMVHPREVVRACLHHNAAAVIFAHNHPSGVAEPSQSDISITRKLKNALSLMDIRTLDHLVVGDGDAISLAERGLI